VLVAALAVMVALSRVAQGGEAAATVVVQPGDTLWTIAAARYPGDEPTRPHRRDRAPEQPFQPGDRGGGDPAPAGLDTLIGDGDRIVLREEPNRPLRSVVAAPAVG